MQRENNGPLSIVAELLNKANRAGLFNLNESYLAVTALNELQAMLARTKDPAADSAAAPAGENPAEGGSHGDAGSPGGN